MSRVKRSVDVEYDTSNCMYYVFQPVIHFFDSSADEKNWKEIWHTAYTSLGAAQAAFNHMADKEINHGVWVKESYHGSDLWCLYLKDGNETKGYCVMLHESCLISK